MFEFHLTRYFSLLKELQTNFQHSDIVSVYSKLENLKGLFVSSSMTLDPQCLCFDSWVITSGLNQK